MLTSEKRVTIFHEVTGVSKEFSLEIIVYLNSFLILANDTDLFSEAHMHSHLSRMVFLTESFAFYLPKAELYMFL